MFTDLTNYNFNCFPAGNSINTATIAYGKNQPYESYRLLQRKVSPYR